MRDMIEAQIGAYLIADNRLVELACWDDELLAIELRALTEIDIDFDIGRCQSNLDCPGRNGP